MARIYLRDGDRQVPLTDEQVKQFSQIRNNPEQVAKLTAKILLAPSGEKKDKAAHEAAPSIS